MLCKNCGNILVRGQTICDMCGEPVSYASESAITNDTSYIARPKSGTKPPKTAGTAPIITPKQAQDVEKMVQDTKKKTKWTIVVGLVCGCCALIIIACTIVFLHVFGYI